MLFPHVKTGRTLLRPADPPDGVTVYELLQKAGLENLSSAELFAMMHLSDISAKFMVERRENGRTVGFASLHHLDQAGGHVQASVVTDESAASDGTAEEATMLVVNYAFAMWNIRKVYFWTADTGFEARSAFLKPAHEATLSEHLYDRGQLRDLYISAVYREQWVPEGPRTLARLVQTPLGSAEDQTDRPRMEGH
ncbi:GNAT family N-acetyltransferase [Sinosporangium siamense]|uniref:GNAT family N-acetyltransferase n=1 Tax=Sinosporangium siamense TaxID=1367973 RepID=UPI001950AAE1|nr:GNAT family protein [Sinosporangium siamense]